MAGLYETLDRLEKSIKPGARADVTLTASPKDRSVLPTGDSERVTRPVKANDPPGSQVRPRSPVAPRGRSPRAGTSVRADAATGTSLLAEVAETAPEQGRHQERYSFQVYTDQKVRLLDLESRYQLQTGRRFSKSRAIREALDVFMDKLQVALDQASATLPPMGEGGDPAA